VATEYPVAVSRSLACALAVVPLHRLDGVGDRRRRSRPSGAGSWTRSGRESSTREPFLHVGSWRRIMFPETGRNIPFTIENYAFVDQFGRETVSWIRTFESRRTRRFDAYMIHGDTRGRIVDYLGSHEHLAVDIDLSVDDNGGLRLRSAAHRFYEGVIGFSFPLLFSGIADVRE
jgi:uncharacterized protein DUF4166